MTNDIVKIQAALMAANNLEAKLEALGTNFPIVTELMELQQHLDHHITDLRLLQAITEINNKCLEWEDRLSDIEALGDDATDIFATIHQLTFETQSEIDVINKRRGIA